MKSHVNFEILLRLYQSLLKNVFIGLRTRRESKKQIGLVIPYPQISHELLSQQISNYSRLILI